MTSNYWFSSHLQPACSCQLTMLVGPQYLCLVHKCIAWSLARCFFVSVVTKLSETVQTNVIPKRIRSSKQCDKWALVWGFLEAGFHCSEACREFGHNGRWNQYSFFAILHSACEVCVGAASVYSTQCLCFNKCLLCSCRWDFLTSILSLLASRMVTEGMFNTW